MQRVALPSFLARAAAMMFHSSSVADQWDTWAFVENGTFYAYYLTLQHSTWFADSFGVATSNDGTHFTDHGVVFTGRCLAPPCGERPWSPGFWMGSGSVWRAKDGRYVVNWSQDRAGTQNISFAVSRNLIHWEGIDEIYGPDPRYYHTHAPNGVRWDNMYTLPASPTIGTRDGYPRHGYWTATPLGCGPYGLCKRTMGFGVTHDGLKWEALQSPAMVPPTVHWSEVGAVEWVVAANGSGAGRYVAMLGGNPANQAAEMIVYTAERPQGPFTAQAKNAIVLPAAASCYFARFFRGPNLELLVTHQSFAHIGRTYIAPYKAVDLGADGAVRLAWWDANRNLKAAELPVATTPDGFFTPVVDVAEGAIFEGTLALPPAGAPLVRWPGFLLEQVGGNATLVALDSAARCVIANVSTANKSAVLHTWDRELSGLGATVEARLLYRRDMLELYVNDLLLPVYLMPPSTGRVRLTASAASGEAPPDVRRWTMSLK